MPFWHTAILTKTDTLNLMQHERTNFNGYPQAGVMKIHHPRLTYYDIPG